MIDFPQSARERVTAPSPAILSSAEAKIWPSPKMGDKNSTTVFGVADALDGPDICKPISVEPPGFLKKGNKKSCRRYYNDLARAALAPSRDPATSCRGPCARHGKEQQVVSCPPRRWRPDRLSLHSVRSSVERHALAGGGASPTPSRDVTSAPASAIPTTPRRRHILQGRHALGTPMRGTSDQRQTQAWGAGR